MSRKTLKIDAGIAAVLAILVLILSPGLAIAGLFAIFVVIICAATFVVGWRRGRRQQRPGRRDRRFSARRP